MKSEKIILPTADAVAQTAAKDLAKRIIELLNTRGKASVVLTGGTVGIRTLEFLAPLLADLDLTGLHFWWGDERFVPSDSAERNQLQATVALLSKIAISTTNLHPFPSSGRFDLLSAAKIFGEQIEKIAPEFDVLLLGMGPDGHVASLFPQDSFQEVNSWVVIETNSPKPPPERISLSYWAINTADEIWLLVAGEEKAEATGKLLSGQSNLPASRVAGKTLTRWYLDEAAASAITS